MALPVDSAALAPADPATPQQQGGGPHTRSAVATAATPPPSFGAPDRRVHGHPCAGPVAFFIDGEGRERDGPPLAGGLS